MTKEEILELWEDGLGTDKSIKVIENGSWEVDYKYELKTTIIEYEPTGKYYQINEARTGSYFSDYHYEDPDIYEVTPTKKMVEITTWNLVES